jgi:hypothetical protein
MARSAVFQNCCPADFQIGSALAGWETRSTADLEVCATRKKGKIRVIHNEETHEAALREMAHRIGCPGLLGSAVTLAVKYFVAII